MLKGSPRFVLVEMQAIFLFYSAHVQQVEMNGQQIKMNVQQENEDERTADREIHIERVDI